MARQTAPKLKRLVITGDESEQPMRYRYELSGIKSAAGWSNVWNAKVDLVGNRRGRSLRPAFGSSSRWYKTAMMQSGGRITAANKERSRL
jgi:hypothetical protein